MVGFTATALTIATIASTGLAVYSAVEQGKAAEDAADFNAEIAENEAQLKFQTGLENVRRQREKNRRFLSRQRALIAGRGIALEGTALSIMSKSAGTLELGIADAFRDTTIAANLSRSQAAQSRFGGDQARRAGFIKAGTSLIAGANAGITQQVNLRDVQ